MDWLQDSYGEVSSEEEEEEREGGGAGAGADAVVQQNLGEHGSAPTNLKAGGRKRKRTERLKQKQDASVAIRPGERKSDAAEIGSQRRACQDAAESAKRIKLPPLPADLFDAAVVVEERTKHKGRIRTFPHIEGNYPTFVYLPVYITAIKGLTGVMDELMHDFQAWLPGQEAHPITDTTEEKNDRPLEQIYHVSISRTVGMKQHQINPFIELLRQTFSEERSFEASFGDYEVFTNDEKNRSFMSLRIAQGKQRICNFIEKVDQLLGHFRLPPYYQDPRPHMTVGWVLGDVLGSLGDRRVGTLPSEFRFTIDRVQCTPGRLIYDIPLKPL